MKKKNKVHIIGLLIILVASIFLKCTIKEENYSAVRVIKSNLESRWHYYDFVSDSVHMKNYFYGLNKILNELPNVKGEIEVIGERSVLAKDLDIKIELFVYSKDKNNYYNTIYIYTNDSVLQKEITYRYLLPDIPCFCNEHYFYLSNDVYPNINYNIYSLDYFGKNGRSIKIMMSERFDSFINVKSPCDSIEIDKAIIYIDKQIGSILK
jgi:hypothetical protein